MDEITQRIHKFISDELHQHIIRDSRIPNMNMDNFLCYNSEEEWVKIVLNMNLLKYDDLKYVIFKKYEDGDEKLPARFMNGYRMPNPPYKYYKMYTNYSFYINIILFQRNAEYNSETSYNYSSNKIQLDYKFPYFPQYNFYLSIDNENHTNGFRIWLENNLYHKYNINCRGYYNKNGEIISVESDKYNLFCQFLNNEIRPYIQKTILPEIYLYQLSQMSAIEQHKWMFENIPNFQLSILEEKENKIQELEEELNEYLEENRQQLQLLQTKDNEIKSLQEKVAQLKETNENNTSLFQQKNDENIVLLNTKETEMNAFREQIFQLQEKNNYVENELLEFMKQNKKLNLQLETTTNLLNKLQLKELGEE